MFLACLAGSGFLVAQSPAPQPGSSVHNDALPVYIEEFFLSEAVRSEERGELQATVDSRFFRGQGSAYDGKAADLTLEYGITRRLQASLEMPYGIGATPFSETPVSWSVVSPGVLYQFILSNHPFALSAAFNASIPVNDRAEASYEPELMIAKGFGKLQIHTSLAPEFSEDESSLAYNVAAVRPLSRHWIPTLEFNGARSGGGNSLYLTPGLYTHLPHRLEVGAAIPAGLGGRSNPAGFIFKMTWEVGGDDD